MKLRYVFILFLAMLPGCAASTSVPLLPGGWAKRWPDGVVLVDVAQRDHRFVVFSYSGPAELLRVNRIRHAGFVAAIFLTGAEKPAFLFESGEANPPVVIDCSRATAGFYTFTRTVYDWRSPHDEPVPFIRETVNVHAARGPAAVDRRLLLEPEPGDAADVARWRGRALAALKKSDDQTEAEVYLAFKHLRNLSIDHPEESAAAMREIAPLTDGAVAESWDEIASEMDELRVLVGRPGPKLDMRR